MMEALIPMIVVSFPLVFMILINIFIVIRQRKKAELPNAKEAPVESRTATNNTFRTSSLRVAFCKKCGRQIEPDSVRCKFCRKRQ